MLFVNTGIRLRCRVKLSCRSTSALSGPGIRGTYFVRQAGSSLRVAMCICSSCVCRVGCCWCAAAVTFALQHVRVYSDDGLLCMLSKKRAPTGKQTLGKMLHDSACHCLANLDALWLLLLGRVLLRDGDD